MQFHPIFEELLHAFDTRPPVRNEGKMTQKQKKFLHYSWITPFVWALFYFIRHAGNAVQATGLVDETIDTSNEYSKYGLNHYQLDYYVDNMGLVAVELE